MEIIEKEAVPVIRIGIIHTVPCVSAENLGAFGASGVQPITCSWLNRDGAILLRHK